MLYNRNTVRAMLPLISSAIEAIHKSGTAAALFQPLIEQEEQSITVERGSIREALGTKLQALLRKGFSLAHDKLL